MFFPCFSELLLPWRRALIALIGAVLVVATVWAFQTADKIRIGFL